MILSGMSDLEQVKANIATFQMGVPLSSREMDRLLAQAQRMVSKTALPCTACHYCVSHCPQGLDIPSLLALYNEHAFTGGGFLAPMALSALPQDKWPSACIGCHSCAMACPYGAPSFGTDGKMIKCDGCIERWRHGLEPACVRTCPTGAIALRDMDEA